MMGAGGSLSCDGGQTVFKSAHTVGSDSKADEFHGVLNLSPEESKWLIDLLNAPAREPTPAMIRALQRRRELLGE